MGSKMDTIAMYVGYAVLAIAFTVLVGGLFLLLWHTALSFIFLHRLRQDGIVWKTKNPFKKFWYAFSFDADKSGNTFFPGREWKD